MYSYQETGGKFICTGGWTFPTEVQAQEFCQLWNQHWGAMAPLDTMPPKMDRAEYEAACIQLGAEILPDEKCDSYGVRYGEFGPWSGGYRAEKYTPEFCVKMALALRRLYGIEAGRKAIQKPLVIPEIVECDCGHMVSRVLVMSASRGSSCPDCYDEMSN
jgi:hypothetical protein